MKMKMKQIAQYDTTFNIPYSSATEYAKADNATKAGKRVRVTVEEYVEQVPAWRWVVRGPEYLSREYTISDYFREGRETLTYADWQLIHRIEESKIMIDAV